MNILTGIDLPPSSPGGSVELLRDLYLGSSSLIPADVFMLAPVGGPSAGVDGRPTLLDVGEKAVSGPSFWAYVDKLSASIQERFKSTDYDVLHLQHLTFGATPALQRVFPNKPKIALVHGTDLLFAADNETQAEVLRKTIEAVDTVVVPSGAMADRLVQMTPVPQGRIVQVPWGIPDSLLARKPTRHQRPIGVLRVLYAGRLTGEKATSRLLASIAEIEWIELSVAAPEEEFAILSDRVDLSAIRYLGWLARESLWEEFAEHDLLVVPSTKLEAFGLVAVEAQACGLPVAYQPVPGLKEVLGDSAISIDFGEPRGFFLCLRALYESEELLEETRQAGLVNSARFPLSKTARLLNELSREVAARPFGSMYG